MPFLFLAAGAVLVFAIAAAVIGREAGRLEAAAPRPVYDVDEAVAWIADRLPESVQAQLTHAELRRILLCSADLLRLLGFEERVASEDEAVAHVTAIVGLPANHVRAALRAQEDYLQVIGAAGAVASFPPEKGGGPAER